MDKDFVITVELNSNKKLQLIFTLPYTEVIPFIKSLLKYMNRNEQDVNNIYIQLRDKTLLN